MGSFRLSAAIDSMILSGYIGSEADVIYPPKEGMDDMYISYTNQMVVVVVIRQRIAGDRMTDMGVTSGKQANTTY